jgi:hypothetical protein
VRVLDVEEAARGLRELATAMPIDHVFLWERIAGMPDAIAQRHVELLADQLAPLLAGPMPALTAAVPNATAPSPVPRGDRR